MSSDPDQSTGFAGERSKLTRAAVEFCLTDLEVALTMMDVARSTNNAETRARNRVHAHRALQTVLHHLSRLELTQSERQQVDAKVRELEARLREVPAG